MRRAVQQLAAEFVGTFFLVFLAAGALSIDPWLKAAGSPELGTLGVALAYGLAAAGAIEAFGPVSGAHFNPAISLGAWATGRIHTLRLAGYALMQLLASLAAARLLEALLPTSAWQAAALGTPVLAASLTRAQGMELEGILTFALAAVFFRTQISAGRPSGWAVGAVVVAAVFVAFPLTGAALNPARALGPAVVSNHWGNQGVWWVGPLAGGVLGAWFAKLLGGSGAS